MPDEEKDSMDRLMQAAVDAGDFQYAGMVAAADALGLKMDDPKVVTALGQIKSHASFDKELARLGRFKADNPGKFKDGDGDA